MMTIEEKKEKLADIIIERSLNTAKILLSRSLPARKAITILTASRPHSIRKG